jgi:hypothetical protein
MTLALGLLLLAGWPQQSSPPISRGPVIESQLEIPDEIAPAITFYMRCLLASRGIPIGPPGGTHETPVVPVGADCSQQRSEAARRADAMLIARHRSDHDERHSLIERTLTSVETFVASIRAPTPPIEAAGNR